MKTRADLWTIAWFATTHDWHRLRHATVGVSFDSWEAAKHLYIEKAKYAFDGGRNYLGVKELAEDLQRDLHVERLAVWDEIQALTNHDFGIDPQTGEAFDKWAGDVYWTDDDFLRVLAEFTINQPHERLPSRFAVEIGGVAPPFNIDWNLIERWIAATEQIDRYAERLLYLEALEHVLPTTPSLILVGERDGGFRREQKSSDPDTGLTDSNDALSAPLGDGFEPSDRAKEWAEKLTDIGLEPKQGRRIWLLYDYLYYEHIYQRYDRSKGGPAVRRPASKNTIWEAIVNEEARLDGVSNPEGEELKKAIRAVGQMMYDIEKKKLGHRMELKDLYDLALAAKVLADDGVIAKTTDQIRQD